MSRFAIASCRSGLTEACAPLGPRRPPREIVRAGHQGRHVPVSQASRLSRRAARTPQALKSLGLKLKIVANPTKQMLLDHTEYAGIQQYFDEIISSGEEAKAFANRPKSSTSASVRQDAEKRDPLGHWPFLGNYRGRHCWSRYRVDQSRPAPRPADRRYAYNVPNFRPIPSLASDSGRNPGSGRRSVSRQVAPQARDKRFSWKLVRNPRRRASLHYERIALTIRSRMW